MPCDFNRIIDYCLSQNLIVQIENFCNFDQELLSMNRNMILTVRGYKGSVKFPITPCTSTDHVIEQILCWASSCKKVNKDVS